MNRDEVVDAVASAIEANDPTRALNALADHYRWLSKESLRGFTPDPKRSQFWRKLSSECRRIAKIELKDID